MIMFGSKPAAAALTIITGLLTGGGMRVALVKSFFLMAGAVTSLAFALT